MTHLLFHKTPNSVSSEPGAAQQEALAFNRQEALSKLFHLNNLNNSLIIPQ
jgi:hypothetical protein